MWDPDLLQYVHPIGGPGLTEEAYRLPDRQLGPQSQTPLADTFVESPVTMPDKGIGLPYAMRPQAS